MRHTDQLQFDEPSPALRREVKVHASPELCCPICKGDLDRRVDAYRCPTCDRTYPVVLGIPDFRVFPDPYISIENDRKKGEFLQANAAHLNFENLVRFYWSITPDATPDLAERFIRKTVLLAEKWSEGIPNVEAQLAEKPRAVLEIGCGTAGFIAAAAERYEQVVGVDIAFRWLVIARKRLHEAGLDCPLVCACAEYLPFRDRQFDLVFGEAVLEHVRDQPAALKEASRVSLPGGTFYLVTPNRYSLGTEPHVGVWGVGFLPRRWMSRYVELAKGIPYRHLRSVSRFELARLLRKGGFRRIQFLIPQPTSPEVARFSRGEMFQLAAYNLVRRLPLGAYLLHLVGPILNVVCHPENTQPCSTKRGAAHAP
ncbi:MAG TPA: methyltransferase domain-containing protein [Rhodothermales bacterium]|nr:methyltransferase domain-containing protein [Rhodothermales bacterium]